MGAAALLLAFSGVGFAQQMIHMGHLDQQPSPTATPASLPVFTPEFNADMLVAHQHYTEAIAAYRKIQPQTAEIENKIGMAYQHLGMEEDAKDNYKKAMKMDRKYAASYNNLGTVYYHAKDYKRAEQLYRKSIRLDGKVAAFWSNLGAVYIAGKKYHDGAEAYQHAFTLDSDIFHEIELNGIREIASNEDLSKIYFCFAEIYAQAGMKDVALDYLRKAIVEGFRDRNTLQQDQQLAVLHGNPEFDQLLAQEHLK